MTIEQDENELKKLFPLMSELHFLGNHWYVDGHSAIVSNQDNGYRQAKEVQLVLRGYGKEIAMTFEKAKAWHKRMREDSDRRWQQTLYENGMIDVLPKESEQ